MGVCESIALMPVCSGSLTPWRCTTDGACNSRARRSSVSTSPRPSIGWPSGLTTRPRKASPTGTDSTSPVRLTCWPCSIFSKSPRITAPMSCSSRLSATPSTPPGNSSSSCVITEGSPSTCAMPSPASMTVPISSRSVSASKPATYSSMAPWISSAEIVNSAILFSSSRRRSSAASRLSASCVGLVLSGSFGQVVLGRRQLGRQRAVDHLVANRDREAAEQRRVDVQLKRHRVAVDAVEQLGQSVSLCVAELACGPHVRNDFATSGHREIRQLADCVIRPLPVQQFDRLTKQVGGVLARSAVKHVVQQADSAIQRRRVVAQQGYQPRLGVEDAAEPEELLLHVLDLTVGFGAHQQGEPGDVLDAARQVCA